MCFPIMIQNIKKVGLYGFNCVPCRSLEGKLVTTHIHSKSFQHIISCNVDFDINDRKLCLDKSLLWLMQSYKIMKFDTLQWIT